MPSPLCEIREGSGAWQSTTDGVDVTPGATITIRLVSSDVSAWSISIIGADETAGQDAPAGYTTPVLSVDSVARTATFTAPENTPAGWTLIFQSKVNGGLDANRRYDASYTTTFGIFGLTDGGMRVGATNETTEGDAAAGWCGKINRLIRSGGGISALSGDVTGDSDENVVETISGAAVNDGTHVHRIPVGTLPTSDGADDVLGVGLNAGMAYVTPEGVLVGAAPDSPSSLPGKIERTIQVATEDDTPLGASVVTLPDGMVAALWIDVLAEDSDGTKYGAWCFHARAKRSGSTITYWSGPDERAEGHAADDGIPLENVEITSSDGAVVVQVTGLAMTLIHWVISARVLHTGAFS